MWNDRFCVHWSFTVFVVCSLFLLPLKLVISWLLAVAIHEFSHIIALHLLKIRILRVMLTASGAFIETDAMQPKKEIICAFMGPLGGLLGFVFLQLNPYFAIFSLILSVFNLLPIYPADGGRILKSILTIMLGEEVASCAVNVINTVVMIFFVIVGNVAAFGLPFLQVPVLAISAYPAISVVKNTLQRRRKNSTM